ncbi:MAG TPA: hypothetical protein VFN48_05030 [Solirubrobacteraceae bacterium]|nr:hypothetical protein [Solirubrobacteraceae bacterium]
MPLRNRPPAIETSALTGAKTFEHVSDAALAVVAWLNANRVDYVVVGPVARIVHGDSSARGPLAIVPAPYGRNLDRLVRALGAARARTRLPGEATGSAGESPLAESHPVRLSPERLLDPERLTLRCGSHDLDIEGQPAGVPRYQELLYEAAKVGLAPEITAEIAGVADVAHFEHLRRTGVPPEIRVSRAVRSPAGAVVEASAAGAARAPAAPSPLRRG